MNDLFRFLLLRPAHPIAPEASHTLSATFLPPGANLREAKAHAAQFAKRTNAFPNTADFKLAATARALSSYLGKRSMPVEQLNAFVTEHSGQSAKMLVALPVFLAEEQSLVDALYALKLLSSSLGQNAQQLAYLIRGYDALRQIATEQAQVTLRALSIPDLPRGSAQSPIAGETHRPVLSTAQASPAPALPELEAAYAALRGLSIASFQLPTELRAPTTGSGAEKKRIKPNASRSEGEGVEQPAWTLTKIAARSLGNDVLHTLERLGLDVTTRPLPDVLEQVYLATTALEASAWKAHPSESSELVLVGNSYNAVQPSQFVGTPEFSLPTGHGNIKPVGIGDLLLVKQHVVRYEGGDLAHIENVLKTEHMSRETRRLERTETILVQESESTKEEQRDTQSTDRFSLKRETTDTIKREYSLKAGLTVDAKYGPTVELQATTGLSTSSSVTSSVQQATEFSKDIVSRASSKLVDRVLERRTVTSLNEFEEKFEHGFDNKDGAGHVSGFYQWVNKVMQAQVNNYGRRLMFDVTLPEPSVNFILMQLNATGQNQTAIKPPALTLHAKQINETNYTRLGLAYGATGLEAPPPLFKSFSKSIQISSTQVPHEFSQADTIPLEEGYAASYALFRRVALGWDDTNLMFQVIVGEKVIDAWQTDGYLSMARETGSIPIALIGYWVELVGLTIEIFCERTSKLFERWQLKTHAAITQAYQARLQEYEQVKAQAMAASGEMLSGRNPGFNASIVSSELRRQCLTHLTAQQFDGFGAMELSSQGFAQPNLVRSESQMPYVRFFEQAFEWEHMTYNHYPYFWGWKDAWPKHVFLNDSDPQFADFLRAGATRVVFPVRPGFETAVVHYLETGEIWNGGPPPDIATSLYVPIIQEILEASGAPGNETPVGEPWQVHLPTTLVRVRPNNDMPQWSKVGEEWTPTN